VPGTLAAGKKIYKSINDLQADLDAWLDQYNIRDGGATARRPCAPSSIRWS